MVYRTSFNRTQAAAWQYGYGAGYFDATFVYTDAPNITGYRIPPKIHSCGDKSNGAIPYSAEWQQGYDSGWTDCAESETPYREDEVFYAKFGNTKKPYI